jgi:hypothetical protein
MNDKEPITYEECQEYLERNSTLENWKGLKNSDGGYDREIKVTVQKDKALWVMADRYLFGDEEHRQQLICKLAKALYNAKAQGIV